MMVFTIFKIIVIKKGFNWIKNFVVFGPNQEEKFRNTFDPEMKPKLEIKPDN